MMNATYTAHKRRIQERIAPATVRFQVPQLLETGARGYAIDPGCFGADVTRWIMAKLARRGIDVDADLVQSAYTWQFGFARAGQRYRVEIGYRPDRADDAGTWIATVETLRRPFRLLLEGFRGASAPDAVEELYALLMASPGVTDVERHPGGASAAWANGDLRVCG